MKVSSRRLPRGSVSQGSPRESRSVLRYRIKQFAWALWAYVWPESVSDAEAVLAGPLFALFRKMSQGEQAHGLRVMRRLREGVNPAPPELLHAALLHDVGKTRFPLRLWERAVIVLARWLAPALANRWSQGEPKGWRRPFVIGAWHAEWGAQMAVEGGVASLTAALIRRHPDAPPAYPPFTEEDRLLRLLQEADAIS